MPKPWRSLTEAENVEIVSPEGEIRSTVEAWFAGSMFVIEDQSAVILPGDEIRRTLPNGTQDVYLARDPTFFGSGGFGPHYQIKVSRKGMYPRHEGGHFQIKVEGANARVNIGSHDASTNIASDNRIFLDIRSAIQTSGIPSEKQDELLSRLAELEIAKDRSSFSKAYQAFISSAADHISVITPFLPALTSLLSALPS